MLGRYYKPNNTTLLYLNSSFNCKKSSSLSLALTSAGAGYTSAPTITITSTAGDDGSGAAATCTLTPTRVHSFSILNGGSGYAVNDVVVIDNTGTGAIQSVAARVDSVGGSGNITGIYILVIGSYTIKAPTVSSITSVNGTGAVIRANLASTTLGSITVTNNGSGYNKLPTITLSGGNPTTDAVITPSFLRTFQYSWEIPDIEINDLAKLHALNIVATGTSTTTPYTFRIRNLQIDSRNTFFSDYGSPILSIAQNTNITNIGSLGAGEYAIILTPQTIRQISLSVDDSITTKDTGVLAGINFVIALEIIEFNPTYQEKTDPYQEAYANRLRPMI